MALATTSIWRRTSSAKRDSMTTPRLQITRSVVNRTALLASAAALLGSCSAGTAIPTPKTTMQKGTADAPSPTSVRNSRFVKTVKLDDGALTVVPAPQSLRPTSGRAAMETKIWATSQLSAGFKSQNLGFGLVTIRPTTPGMPHVKDLPAWIGIATNAGVFAASCPATLPAASLSRPRHPRRLLPPEKRLS